MDEAKEALHRVEDGTTRVAYRKLGDFTGPPVPDQRRLARRYITRVVISANKVKGRNAFDPERISIEWLSKDAV